MPDEGWTVVGRKGRSVSQANADAAERMAGGNGDASAAQAGASMPVDKCVQHVAQLQQTLGSSGFASSLRRALHSADQGGLRLDTVTSLCCYGLGPPTRSANARAQAALIPLLRAMLPACTSLEAYDPVFEEDDAAVLRELGCRVLPEHEVSGRRVDAVTLFYMPHCDAELYNDLLDANWSSAAICNVVIIGNSFEHMTERWSGPGRRRVQAKPHRVLAATEHAVVREIALAGDDAPVRNCFNDTSLHWFSRERVKEFEELFRA